MVLEELFKVEDLSDYQRKVEERADTLEGAEKNTFLLFVETYRNLELRPRLREGELEEYISLTEDEESERNIVRPLESDMQEDSAAISKQIANRIKSGDVEGAFNYFRVTGTPLSADDYVEVKNPVHEILVGFKVDDNWRGYKTALSVFGCMGLDYDEHIHTKQASYIAMTKGKEHRPDLYWQSVDACGKGFSLAFLEQMEGTFKGLDLSAFKERPAEEIPEAPADAVVSEPEVVPEQEPSPESGVEELPAVQPPESSGTGLVTEEQGNSDVPEPAKPENLK